MSVFLGTQDARISGFEVNVEVIAIDRLFLLRLPVATECVQADQKTYNACVASQAGASPRS